ncbi:uncharacterized protein At2g29880-like [Punica granatum]|uniref:Uncharacterized protein At2g29880-like n=2 Tax=Punica granatum TaxID=22663 RepID=A0A6P8CE67_PUNGR|nr:uncharacterized protein At2g29880-like [Punica granatum]XP_031379776.1 uncharacterized protein At2g29880-like [Punica granatum]XP_031379777.1 uncharacterized protein At2g29880-like [Punica granatum]XP_031379778.1 uncharacterized protein At2g29880-like [Punica granatum]
MAPKGENIIIDWSDEMEFAFINIMLEKLRRSHSTTWKKTTWKEITAEMVNLFPEQQLCLQKVKDKHQRMKTNFTRFSEIVRHTGVGWDAETNTITADQDVWDMFAKKNRAYKAFRSKGCNHYDLQKQLFSSSVATGALRISSTDPPPTLEEERRLNEDFLSRGKGKGKQQVDLEEGSDDSDDLVQIQAEPMITESRRRAPKKRLSKSSQMQECMDLFRESYTKPQPQNTPPSAKRSKSVTSPEKPEKNSIEEALEELAKLKSRIPHSLYVKAANALLDPGARRLFMWFKEDDRQEWIMQLPHS